LLTRNNIVSEIKGILNFRLETGGADGIKVPGRSIIRTIEKNSSLLNRGHWTGLVLFVILRAAKTTIEYRRACINPVAAACLFIHAGVTPNAGSPIHQSTQELPCPT
jgi:hypothetical protein